MNAAGFGLACDLDDLCAVQIRLRRGRRPDRIRFVGGAHMQGIGVSLGIDGDDTQPHAPRGAGDAAGDLAAIGDQDGFEQR
jgi:hypothetical protein